MITVEEMMASRLYQFNATRVKDPEGLLDALVDAYNNYGRDDDLFDLNEKTFSRAFIWADTPQPARFWADMDEESYNFNRATYYD